MATKQNMYVGKEKQAKEIIEKINESVIAWKLNDDGIREISIYQSDKAEAIRDKVANMQGQLEVLLEGLDKNSTKRSVYQEMWEGTNEFMRIFS